MALILFSVLPLHAGPGDGINVGNFKITPYAETSFTYDDNVSLSGSDEEDDCYLDLLLGIGFLNTTERLDLEGRVWGHIRRYDTYGDEEDFDDFGEKIGVRYGSLESLQISVAQRYARITDYDTTQTGIDAPETEALIVAQDRTERSERDLFDGSVKVERMLTDKLEGALAYDYTSVDYDPSNLFDFNQHQGRAEFKYRMTDKTKATLKIFSGIQDSDAFSDDSDYRIARLGIRSYNLSKLIMVMGVGVQDYDFGVSTDEDPDTFSFNGGLYWLATDRLRLSLYAQNFAQPSADLADNPKNVSQFSAGIHYDIMDSVNLLLSSGFSSNEYLNEVVVNGRNEEKESDTWSHRLRVTYKPPADFMTVYWQAEYSDTEDSIVEDYDELRLSVGIGVRY